MAVSVQRMPASAGRVAYLDGIRGWAAASVVLYHVFWESLGHRFPEIRASFVAPFFNGPLAVYLFFVLSGDALSTQFLQTGERRVLQRGVLYRYFRLTVPILLSCLMSYVLMKAGWVHQKAAGIVLDRTDWLSTFIDFEPDLWGMLKYATYGVYAEHTLANTYNPFLWTMGVELAGSLLVFSYLSVLDLIKRPMLVTLVIFVFLWANKSFYAPFFFGVMLSMARREGHLEVGRYGLRLVVSWSLILHYLWVHVSSGQVTDSIVRGVRESALLALALYLNPPILRFMQWRLSQFLGDISFPSYLVHFAVIVSFLSLGAIELEKAHQLDLPHALGLGLASCVLSLLASLVFMRTERYLQSHVRRWVLGR